MDNVCKYCNQNVLLINDSCILCDIVHNFKKEYTFSCLLGNSKLSQKKIIEKTREFYNSHNRIPLPTELDPDVEIVNLSVYFFSQFQRKDYQIFFTKGVEKHMELAVSRVFKDKPKNKYTIEDYYSIDNIYEFEDDEQKQYDSEIKNIQKKIFKPLEKNNMAFIKMLNKIN
jgi:hypothetical protein